MRARTPDHGEIDGAVTPERLGVHERCTYQSGPLFRAGHEYVSFSAWMRLDKRAGCQYLAAIQYLSYEHIFGDKIFRSVILSCSHYVFVCRTTSKPYFCQLRPPVGILRVRGGKDKPHSTCDTFLSFWNPDQPVSKFETHLRSLLYPSVRSLGGRMLMGACTMK